MNATACDKTRETSYADTSANDDSVRYVVVTGGVVSGLGKGTTISSVGALLRARGVLVTAVKIDPYLNVDAGTMSPEEHGECFVLEDGTEADLDLGCYERFLGVRLMGSHSITTGKVFRELLVRERRGDYLGKTVQIVPHATNLVTEMIEEAARADVWNTLYRNSGIDEATFEADGIDIPAEWVDTAGRPRVCLVELGGTVGDIESSLFLTALRDLRARLGLRRVQVLHVSLVPDVSGDQKTKPTQHSVMALRRAGLTPDMLVCRCSAPLRAATTAKLRTMCQVPVVVCMADAPNLYHVPERLFAQGVDVALGATLGLWDAARPPPVRNAWWRRMSRYLATCATNRHKPVTIGVFGKYVARQSDAYLSLRRAIMHAGQALNSPVAIEWIDTDELDPSDARCAERFNVLDAIVVPGGFGIRGFEEKVAVAAYARAYGVPFLGLCLGFQAAVVEYARAEAGLAGASSEEFLADTSDARERPLVIASMPETDKTKLGGTMRLGICWTRLHPDSLAYELYKNYGDGSNNNECHCDNKIYDEVMYERHRHRYEVAPEYVDALEGAGLVFSGTDCDHTGCGREVGTRMEILELPRWVHPFFVACQFHPEYRSSVSAPHPLFIGLVRAALQPTSCSPSSPRRTPPSADTPSTLVVPARRLAWTEEDAAKSPTYYATV